MNIFFSRRPLYLNHSELSDYIVVGGCVLMTKFIETLQTGGMMGKMI